MYYAAASVSVAPRKWDEPLTQQDYDRRNSIREILGKDYLRCITADNDLSSVYSQINISRQNFARFRLLNKDILQQVRPPRYIGSIPLNSMFIPPKLRVCIEWQSGIKVEQIVIDPSMSGDDLIKLSTKALIDADVRVAADKPCIIKVHGIRSYIAGPEPVSEYDYIRKCVIDGRPPLLVLMYTPQVYLHTASAESPCFVDRVLAANLPQAPAATPISELNLPCFNKPFSFKAIGCCFVVPASSVQKGMHAQLHISIHHGGRLLCPLLKTSVVPCSARHVSNTVQLCAVWDELVIFPVVLGQLPSDARISVVLNVQYSEQQQQTCVGWTNFLPIGYGERLQQGSVTLRLWKGGPASVIGPVADNAEDKDVPLVDLELPKYGTDLSFAETRKEVKEYEETVFVQKIIEGARLLDPEESPEGYAELERLKAVLLAQDALVPMTEAQRELVWKYRFQLIPYPELLPKFLLSTNWANRSQVIEAHL